MTCHAHQQPFPYVVLNHVYQPGTVCDFCDALLDNRRGIYADGDGIYCNDVCWMRAAIRAKQKADTRAMWIAVFAALLILATYLILEVH